MIAIILLQTNYSGELRVKIHTKTITISILLFCSAVWIGFGYFGLKEYHNRKEAIQIFSDIEYNLLQMRKGNLSCTSKIKTDHSVEIFYFNKSKITYSLKNERVRTLLLAMLIKEIAQCQVEHKKEIYRHLIECFESVPL